MKVETKLGKFEDAEAIWFRVGFYDEGLYSLTIDDAYGRTSAEIVTKEYLDKFLKEW